MERVDRVRFSSPLPMYSKKPSLWKPFTTAIRLKSRASVSQSI